jgi:nucleotidyltransferase substrate binding protein (TIGR01987 family)
VSLDLTSLKKAIEALERSLGTSHESAVAENERLMEAVRAGVVQNFEVAYEQSWKFIQRWLVENKSAADAENPRTRKELFRMAARYGLIPDPIAWFSYGDTRNLTAHTYDAEQAIAVYKAAELFLADAMILLANLESLND